MSSCHRRLELRAEGAAAQYAHAGTVSQFRHQVGRRRAADRNPDRAVVAEGDRSVRLRAAEVGALTPNRACGKGGKLVPAVVALTWRLCVNSGARAASSNGDRPSISQPRPRLAGLPAGAGVGQNSFRLHRNMGVMSTELAHLQRIATRFADESADPTRRV